MRRVLPAIGALIAVLAVVVYLRPAAVLFAVRDLKLRRLGFVERDVRVGEHRIHYLVGGDGPPLVLVHGLAMQAKDWSPLLEHFQGRRVYALDLLGAGGSDRPADAEYSVRAHTETVRRFMDALSLRQADVLGVSMGGWIALRLAAEHPERVRRLVLVSSAGFDFPTDIREGTFAPRTLADLRAMMALQSDRPAALPEFVLRDLLRELQKQDRVVRATTRSILTRRDVMEGRLSRVRMPVLLVSGTSDRIVPFDVSARMKAAMPHATLVALPGCGHIAVVECKAGVMDAVNPFLQR